MYGFSTTIPKKQVFSANITNCDTLFMLEKSGNSMYNLIGYKD